MLPKPMSPKEWARYKRRQREREEMILRQAVGARFTPEERAAKLAEVERNSRHGFAVSYPAVGINYGRKNRRIR